MNRTCVVALSSLLTCTLGLAQESLWQEPAIVPCCFSPLGVIVVPHADIDQDGIPEVAVGSWIASTVRIHSGMDGSLLRNLVVDQIPRVHTLVAAGDLNADGSDDLIVAIQGGYRAFSGATGSVLYDMLRPLNSFETDDHAAPAGDMNADGYDDVLIGWFSSQWFGNNLTSGGAGLVELRSGRDGSILRTYDVQALGPGFGGCLVGLPDVDGDGWGEVAVGRMVRWPAPTQGENLRVFSGGTGALLWVDQDIFAATAYQSACTVEDLDGDGFDDLFVAPAATQQAIRVLSSATGLPIVIGSTPRMTIGDSHSLLGTYLRPGRDVDGDGVRDIWLAGPVGFDGGGIGSFRGQDLGEIMLVSGATCLPILQLPGTRPGDQTGCGIVVLGDRDSDGFDEIVSAARGPSIIEAIESGGTLSQPTKVCSGYEGHLNWVGSTGVAASDGSLQLSGSIQGTFWIAFTARETAYQTSFLPGYQGLEPFVLCVGGPITRLNAGPIAAGSGNIPVPASQQSSQFLPGTSWTFQGWVRYHVNASTPYGSSPALRLTWTP
ncbi:MAG: hypothetical protein ACI8QC_001790 [Planctomycetota bacterium]|jgi:hypothetical protein